MSVIGTGNKVIQSGIYECIMCRNKITCVKGDKCPPCRKCNCTFFKLVQATK